MFPSTEDLDDSSVEDLLTSWTGTVIDCSQNYQKGIQTRKNEMMKERYVIKIPASDRSYESK